MFKAFVLQLLKNHKTLVWLVNLTVLTVVIFCLAEDWVEVGLEGRQYINKYSPRVIQCCVRGRLLLHTKCKYSRPSLIGMAWHWHLFRLVKVSD